MTDTITFYFRGADRECRIVGHCGKHRDVTVGYCMMPSTGTEYLLVGDSKSMNKSQWSTFETDDREAREAFVKMVRTEHKDMSRWLSDQHKWLTEARMLLNIAQGLTEEWSEAPIYPEHGRTYLVRVKDGELHYTDDAIDAITGWYIKRLSRERTVLENSPQTIKRLEKKIAKLEKLLTKWGARP